MCLPDDVATEKTQLLQAFGARVERLRPVSISHPQHMVHVARRRAQEDPHGCALTGSPSQNCTFPRAFC